MFSAMITAAITEAAMVVMRRLTSGAHDSALRREHDQRDQRERDAEREHDLREHERPRRVDTDCDHDERRQHRDERGAR